ncbi:MAG TPA: hypothetical protein ACFYD3_07385 [Candidatus Hypogeohydataceae bacterium YC41]
MGKHTGLPLQWANIRLRRIRPYMGRFDMERLLAILISVCWITGFFILAQIIWHQHHFAEKLKDLERKLQ